MGFVARFIKALPHGMVGCAALVGLLPLFAQGAQGFLHLAPANGLPFRALEQSFGLGYQTFAQLVGTPALPAFQLAGCGQRRMGLVLQLVVNDLAKLLQGVAQRTGSTGTGLPVPFGNLRFQGCQHLPHGVVGLGTDFRVHLGFGLLGSRLLHRHAARCTQLIGPYGNGWQCCRRILCGGDRLRQSSLKSIPDQQQLTARRFQ